MLIFALMNPANLWPQGQVSGYCFIPSLLLRPLNDFDFRAIYPHVIVLIIDEGMHPT